MEIVKQPLNFYKVFLIRVFYPQSFISTNTDNEAQAKRYSLVFRKEVS